VPISLQVFAGAELQQRGIARLEELQLSTPNFQVTETGIGTQMYIRGIGTGNDPAFEQSVAQFVDGVSYGRSRLTRAPFFDLERIEVLRGPQSVLFGKNTTAGALSLIRSFRPFTAHRVLRPFLESYRVFADALLRVDPERPVDRPALVQSCLGLGKQYQLQHFVHSASSVSKVLFETAHRLADNRGLLDHRARDVAERRRAFADEIADWNRRVEAIVALAASRRAGLID